MFGIWQDFLANIATQDKLAKWLQTLPNDLQNFVNSKEGEEFYKHLKKLERFQNFKSDKFNLNTEYVSFGDDSLTERQKIMTKELFKDLMPWRKGPYELFGQKAETEWLSFKKWDRLLPHISSLKDRNVLDVGCGNGYHMWRMLGEGAKQVIGIDPCALFVAQFELFKRCISNTDISSRINLLPLGIEQLPELNSFDTVFSMGVLYHRRSPIDHLYQLQNQLVPGGELVLETLVIDVMKIPY